MTKAHTKAAPVDKDVETYHRSLSLAEKAICELLAEKISIILPGAEKKVWHGHPVWFLEGNPIVGYDKQKDCIRILFWSGQSFEEPGLHPEGKFKAAEARYADVKEINTKDLERWLQKSKTIQWDYKNIIKRKGMLERLD
ncbi:MAG: DUF1801 domain-containing protein [Bacteroidetes bacterium]|nr:DUF1801 domain-containing protein [Bacteroidota bacterium]MBS1975177.1 DUF1801 domain-containing protein [Bacteroidota bacterium]